MVYQKKKRVPLEIDDGGRVGQQVVDAAFLASPALRGKLPNGNDYIRTILKLHLSSK